MSHNPLYLAMLAAGTLALGTAGTSLAAGPAATSSGDTTLSHQDRAFVKTAADAGMEEVAAGKIAERNTQNADVLRFARRMVDDHSRANDALKRIAQADNIALPDRMDAEARHDVGVLRGAHDARFDARYMEHQASDHREVIAAFQKEADEGRNADLRRFASDTLPTLHEHLRLAEQTEHAIPTKAPMTPSEKKGLEAAKAGTGASSVAAEKNEHMPVPKTNM